MKFDKMTKPDKEAKKPKATKEAKKSGKTKRQWEKPNPMKTSAKKLS